MKASHITILTFGCT